MFKYILLIIILIIAAYFYWWSAISGTVEKFTVRYDDNEVTRKTSLTRKNTLKMPYVQYLGANKGKYYTLMMTNPDQTTIEGPVEYPKREWLVVDIPSDKLIRGSSNIEQMGTIITPYEGVNPSSNPELHIIELYTQPKKLVGPKVRKVQRNWDYEGFIDRHELRKVMERSFLV